MNKEEKDAIDFFIHECEKYDGTIEIKGTSVGEETRILNTIVKYLKELNSLKEIEQLHKEENGKLRVELEQYKLLEANIDKANKIIAENKFDEGLYGLLMQEKEKNNNLIKQLQEQNTEIQDISRQLRQEKEKTPESVRKQFETYQNRICELEEKNKDLEEKLKIATAMLTKGTYPEKNKGDNDFNKQFIAVDKIKEKMKEIMNYTYMSSEERQQQNYAYDRLKELLEEN